ncbi:hypothetical protein OIU74_004688 [Salix koriyanagi]|uniref:Uncharacterized protein n=1 Tax=Salix koriyanagi TaxID=2511006 RepID=A0A9Q0UMP8_9ROSI|nr:hypothetical protein OIU74_004688 [Salix koriyanagi]
MPDIVFMLEGCRVGPDIPSSADPTSQPSRFNDWGPPPAVGVPLLSLAPKGVTCQQSGKVAVNVVGSEEQLARNVKGGVFFYYGGSNSSIVVVVEYSSLKMISGSAMGGSSVVLQFLFYFLGRGQNDGWIFGAGDTKSQDPLEGDGKATEKGRKMMAQHPSSINFELFSNFWWGRRDRTL